jgi:hypothetical protein
VFTPGERYHQLVNTIFSVKKYIPNPIILLVECTKFTQEDGDFLSSICDYVLNTINDTEAPRHVFSEYKGKGERYLVLSGLKFLRKNGVLDSNVKFLFKIAARYELYEKFEWKKYDNQYMNFLEIYSGAVNTTFYKIPHEYVQSLIEFLESDENRVVTVHNGSNEEYIGEYAVLNKDFVQYVKPLGVKGFVAVCSTPYEG